MTIQQWNWGDVVVLAMAAAIVLYVAYGISKGQAEVEEVTMFTWLRLKFWTETQLAMQSARLHGQIDGLASSNRQLHQQLVETMHEIRNLQDLSRLVDHDEAEAIGQLLYREREIRGQIKEVQLRIDRLQKKVELIDHEHDRREPDILKRSRKRSKEMERSYRSKDRIFSRKRRVRRWRR